MDQETQALMDGIRAIEFTPVGRAYHDCTHKDALEDYIASINPSTEEGERLRQEFISQDTLGNFRQYAEAFARNLEHDGLFVYAELKKDEDYYETLQKRFHERAKKANEDGLSDKDLVQLDISWDRDITQYSAQFGFVDLHPDWTRTFHKFEEGEAAENIKSMQKEYLRNVQSTMGTFVKDYNDLGECLTAVAAKMGVDPLTAAASRDCRDTAYEDACRNDTKEDMLASSERMQNALQGLHAMLYTTLGTMAQYINDYSQKSIVNASVQIIDSEPKPVEHEMANVGKQITAEAFERDRQKVSSLPKA